MGTRSDLEVAISNKKRKHNKKENKKSKRHKEEHKNHKKDKKQSKRESLKHQDTKEEEEKEKSRPSPTACAFRPLVESSALPPGSETSNHSLLDHNHPVVVVTLLLFYQYVEPAWSESFYKKTVLTKVRQMAESVHITGRMRVAQEGLNCTLTGSADAIRTWCQLLRQWQPECFHDTEFKLTHDLPESQRFRELKIMPVTELVHYGLDGEKAPLVKKHGGTHLEPAAYHQKLAEPNTVVIDVRNHYEAAIGHFEAPGAEFVDPKMRKSTEFPVWLDDPNTREKLKGKQVLMYCTGGIRCERASALLRYKMENDPEVKDLGIQGVYQLQGGIDKYFKEFPDGGYWKGKNYTFDKRYAHEPTATNNHQEMQLLPIGKCEACRKPWDRYRGKRRCPSCGVPSLVCKQCYTADQNGTKKLDRTIRCDLCVAQGVYSKKVIREQEAEALKRYEQRQQEKGLLKPKVSSVVLPKEPSEGPSPRKGLESSSGPRVPMEANPDNITRLYLKNMCRNTMTEEILLENFQSITHIVWNTRKGVFLGQAWVEMESPAAAAEAVSRSGQIILGRPLYIEYQAADSKDIWPPAKAAVR